MSKTLQKVTAIALSATTVVWLTGAAALLPVASAQSTADEIARLQALIQSLMAQLAALQQQAGVSSGTGTAVACNFTRDLTVGMRGDDVQCLQRYLNRAGFQVAASGPGSPGNETSYFGPLTKAAVVKWQDANAAQVLAPVGLSKGTGYWGPSSRRYYQTLVASQPTTPTVPGTPATPTTPTTPSVPVNGLTVSLAPDNPPADDIPLGAANVEYMKLVVSGSGTLDSLKFKRVGLGDDSDFVSAGVYLYKDGERLTTGKSVNSTTQEVSFVNLNQEVNGSLTLTLKANMDSSNGTAGDINAFELVEVNGTALDQPLRGNEMTLSGTTVSSVTVSETGSVANPNVGAQGVELAEFKLTAGSTEDILVRRITLTHGGSVNVDEITNLELRQGGRVLATAAGVTGRDQYIFELDEPFKILKGQTKTFNVVGDVSPTAKSGETIDFYIDNVADVYATGSQYGFGVEVTNNWASGDQELTLQGAEIVISFHGPIARNIAADAQDVTVFDFSISSQNNIEIRSIKFDATYGNRNTGDKFTDAKLVDAETGAAVTTSVDLDAANNDINFTDVINVSAGEVRRFLFTVDVDSSVDAGDTLAVALKNFDSNDIKNLDNNTYVKPADDIVPNSVIEGNTQTVKDTTLDVSLSGSPASHNTVAGTSREELAAWTITARNGDVEITSVKVGASADTGTQAQLRNDIRSLGLYVDGQLVSSLKNLESGTDEGYATFNNLNLSIPEGATKKMTVKADIASNATASNVYYVYTDLSDWTAVDADGNSLSLSGNINGSKSSVGSVKVTVASPSLTWTVITDSESEAGNVIAGREVLLAKFDGFAKDGALKVTKLQAGVNTTSATAYSTAVVEEVEELRLYDGDGNLLASGAPVGSGTDAGRVLFEDSNGLFDIGANETKRIEVRALLNPIDPLGNGAAHTNLVAYFNDASFEAVSGSTRITAFSGGDPIGNKKRMFKSLPTITVSAPSSSVLTTGDVELLKFTISADSAGDIEWGAIEASVSLLGATIANQGVKVRYAGSNLALTTQLTFEGGTKSAIGDPDGGSSKGKLVVGLTNPERIEAGASKTYELVINVDKIAGGSDPASISGYLAQDSSDYATPAAYDSVENTGATDGSNSFVWSDVSRSPHSKTSADWHNGWKIKVLPSASKSLVK